MPDDIVTRLTAFHGLPRCTTRGCVTCDAAAEIERLREAVDEYKHRLHWANEELLKRGRP